jgi:hypothetical protein
MAGRFAEQRLAVCNFSLRSYIREFGYSAEFATPVGRENRREGGDS